MDDYDYEVIKALLAGTGKIEEGELGHLLKKNPLPFLETLAEFPQVRKEQAGVFRVDLTGFRDEGDFITQVRAVARRRVPWRRRVDWTGPASERAGASGTKKFHLQLGIYEKLVKFGFLLMLCIPLIIIGVYIGRDYPYVGGVLAYLGGGVFWGYVILNFHPYFEERKLVALVNSFPKMVNYLETHEDFARISDLAAVTGQSKKYAIKTLTTLGSGTMRQTSLAAISELRLPGGVPPEETLYFLPLTDAVMKAPRTLVPFQLEQPELDTIWGMLLFEKRIDFAITSEELFLPKYHLLRGILRILGTSLMKFKLTTNSIELLEEKDLSAFFATLKEEFSSWKMPHSAMLESNLT